MSCWERMWTGFFARRWDARARAWRRKAAQASDFPPLARRAVIEAHNAEVRAERLREQQRRA